VSNAVPLAISVTLISFIFWAPFHAVTAAVFAVSLVAFYVYWVVRSYGVGVACWVGLRRISRWKRTDWRAQYEAWARTRTFAAGWDWPRHLVVIPNYRESEEELARTLDSLAAQPNAAQLVIALAMEERETGAQRKAARLLLAYREHFGDIFATFHPAGIPGETPGKGSNEAWAARQAYSRLITSGCHDLARYTITSCDADAVFDPHHFEALNYLFLTARDRHRTFWQPAIFNSNNIWDIPAPLRLPDGLSGVNRVANLVLPGSVKFPTSCYSLSWQMLTQVDYWDEEVIPEDWHIYLKCCFALGDRVHVEPLYLPLGNDCVLTDSYIGTLRAHYTQSVRHAWGASDIPYAWRAVFGRGGPLSRTRRLILASNLTKVHVLWAAQWYIITVGMLVPMKFAQQFGAPMPGWWTHQSVEIPGPGWHLENIVYPQRWLAFDGSGLFEPRMGLTICGLLIAICILPLFSLIAFEFRTRGPRPAYVSWPALIGQFFMWPLMGVITFFWASLPALHAQWKLATGRGLVYRVAQKGGHGVRLSGAEAEAPEEDSAEPSVAYNVTVTVDHETAAVMQSSAGYLPIV
jgi:hypothetical protein